MTLRSVVPCLEHASEIDLHVIAFAAVRFWVKNGKAKSQAAQVD